MLIFEVFAINRSVHKRTLEGDGEKSSRNENGGPLLILLLVVLFHAGRKPKARISEILKFYSFENFQNSQKQWQEYMFLSFLIILLVCCFYVVYRCSFHCVHRKTVCVFIAAIAFIGEAFIAFIETQKGICKTKTQGRDLEQTHRITK